MNLQQFLRRAANSRCLVVKSAEGVRFAHTSTPLPVKTGRQDIRPQQRWWQRGRKLSGMAFRAFIIVLLALIVVSVYVKLTATAPKAKTMDSTPIDLTLAAGSSSAGFSQAVSDMAPGDRYNAYADLTNGGTSPISDPALEVTGSPSTPLTNSATEGLAVAINACTAAWTVPSGNSGPASCTGTTSTPMASTMVNALSQAPGSVVVTLAANQTTYLQVVLTLTGTETTVNGAPPAQSIQSQSTTLTYALIEA